MFLEIYLASYRVSYWVLNQFLWTIFQTSNFRWTYGTIYLVKILKTGLI